MSYQGQNYLNQIHGHLTSCYRSGQVEPWVGNSLQLVIELIRKAEDANPTSMDIRRLSVNLMHRLRIDGIERTPNARESETVIPFSISGRMVSNFKFKL